MWRHTRETYAHYNKIDTLDDEMRSKVWHLHPKCPVCFEFGDGTAPVTPIEYDVRRFVERQKEQCGPQSTEYKDACDALALFLAWEEECRKIDEQNGATKYAQELEDAEQAYRSACDAFHEQKPTTALGIFLQHLMSDEGDNFADEHPEIVETIIQHLQSPLVPAGVDQGVLT